MQRHAGRSLWAIILTALALVLVVEIAGRDEPFLDRLGADCLGTLTIAFIAKYINERPQRVPILEYSLVFMCLFWGLSAAGLSNTGGYMKVPASAKTIAVWLCVLAAATISAGFVVSGRIRPEKELPRRSIDPRDLPRVSAPVLLVWLGLAASVSAGRTLVLPLSIQFVVNLVGSPWPLLTYLSMHAVRSGSGRTLWGAVAVLSAAGALGGFVGGAVLPIIGTVFLLWYLGKPVHPWVIFAIVGLVFVLQPAKAIYRHEVWDREDRLSKEDPISGLQRWGKALDRTWLQEEKTEDHVAGTMSRLDELYTISVAVALCPALVPRNNGQIWLDVLELMVPRLLWPAKPSATDATNSRFQVTFGLQTVEQSKTTTGSFPLPADGWWNFGWLGVAIPGLCIGLLYGWLCRAIGTRTWTRLTLSMVLMMQIHFTTEIASTLTGWMKLLVTTAAVCWVVVALRDRRVIPHPAL